VLPDADELHAADVARDRRRGELARARLVHIAGVGATVRTLVNIDAGGRTRHSGMVHAGVNFVDEIRVPPARRDGAFGSPLGSDLCGGRPKSTDGGRPYRDSQAAWREAGHRRGHGVRFADD
jgi:hypothetical protein